MKLLYCCKGIDTMKLLVYFFCWVWEEINAFGNEQSHMSWSDVTDCMQKYMPRTIILGLSPSIRPTKNDSVGFHTTESSRLYPIHPIKINAKNILKITSSFLQMRQSIANISCNEYIYESFDFFFIHRLSKVLFSSQSFTAASCVIATNNRHAHSQTLSRFQLRSKRKQFPVFWNEIIRQFSKNYDLRSPIFSMWWSFFESQQWETSSRQSQPSDSITPFFLCPVIKFIFVIIMVTLQ